MSQPAVLFEKIRSDLKPVVWAISAVSLFINLLVLPMSLFALQVMDRVVSTGSMPTLIWLTLIMVAMFAVAGVLQTLRGLSLTRVADWVHDAITDTAVPIVLSQAASGNKGAQHLRDAAMLRNFIGGPGLVTLLDAPWSVLFLAGLFLVHSTLGILVSAGALVLLALAWLNELAIREPTMEANARQARNLQEMELATRNAEVTEAMGMGKTLAARWKQLQKRASDVQMSASNRGATIQGFTKFIRLTLQVLVTAVAAWLVIRGEVTTGAIIAAAILASRALAPFEVAISGWKSLTDARVAYIRLNEVFKGIAGSGEVMDLPAPEGSVSAENLEYRPAGREHPILRQVSFRLEPGEMLGIIGPSGSGKSTLARLLVGVYTPTAGSVRLDGADVYRWPKDLLGPHIGYLPQDTELFGGSVKDNISRFTEAATPEAIVKAAQLANAHDLILRLPQGYDTQIGPGGALLSAGQRQRIGLARAFYGNPRLLVLDEPDASLDDAGQQALIMVLRRARHEGITTVIVTHRKSLLAPADKLLLLRDGTAVAFGPKASVLETMAAPQRATRLEGSVNV